MIARYALIATLLACLGLGAALWWQSGTIGTLRDDNASLTQSVAVLEGARDQARAAAAIAEAEAQRQRARAEEYEQVKNAFREGNFNESLPDDFRALLGRVLRSGAR